ncbi:MAG: hypothetical protein K2L51_01455 [Clostridiales bacterium]|nr:hypothetical protein [Clostridiales bacterium]
MIQFMQQLWAWVSSHAAVIAGILTPANLVLVITNLLQIVRQRKAIAANTGSSRELQESLRAVKEAQSTVESLQSLVASQNEQIAALRDGQEQTNTKLNCVLEVQGQAYSVSLAKTQTLDAINGIIANGKFAETHARKAVNEEVVKLRAQLEKALADSKASEEKVKRITGVADTAPKEAVKGVRLD